MPAFVNWLLRLVLTNPICMRLVQGGSRRHRHLLIRSGYLAVMMVILLFAMLSNLQGAPSVRELAVGAAKTFTLISYLQIGLICLLTPIFMAGAIAQEANPRTWDILLTTPLNNLQIVLGNLFGRLFFVLALLVSTLPLFAVTQYFGGVPGESIFASYAIAGSSSLLVAAIAITLCVNRTAGRRAVFWFYVAVVMYLFVTYAADLQIRQPVGPGVQVNHTTLITPLNPFLALEVLLRSNTYQPLDPQEVTGIATLWIMQMALTRPIATFCWVCLGISGVLIGYSTIRARAIGAKTGAAAWHRRMLGLGAPGAVERPARTVSLNPIAWRESVARGRTLTAILARWGFVALGIAVGIALVGLYHTGAWTGPQLQLAAVTVIAAEIVVIALVALNMSASAVSREREDGTLDLILSTPIQPGPYLTGKLRGLIQFLFPLMLVPVATMLILAVYVMADGFGRSGGVWLKDVPLAGKVDRIDLLPVILPEGAIALPLVLIPFTAFCVMIGLHWSIKTKGTIGSVVAAVLVAGGVTGVLGLCGLASGNKIPIVGAVINTLSPVNLLWAIVYPAKAILTGSTPKDIMAARINMVVGALLAAGGYATLVYLMLTTMRRSFMMTVRRLAGAA
ncbi:MAG: ABC transporter permease subunit [Planctomycetota bacterium]|nr:ABC transporter permease subunit [Planctomycetota bacterium]